MKLVERYIKKIPLRRKMITLMLVFAIAVAATLLPNIKGTFAAPQPGTQDYYNARWDDAKSKVGNLTATTAYTAYTDYNDPTTAYTAYTVAEGPWKLDLNYFDPLAADYCSAPWDGTTVTAMTAANTVNGIAYNATTNPYNVTTAGQLRWCMGNRYSFVLGNNIDLGGYLGSQWTTPINTPSTPVIVDGHGYTIYNYYITNKNANSTYTSLFGSMSSNIDSSIKNLRISNAYLNDVSSTYMAIFTNGSAASVSGCAVENSMASTSLGATGYLSGFANASLNASPEIYDNCYTRNVQLYNRGDGTGATFAHAAGFMGGSNSLSITITNCFAVDGTIISNGGHSGGFYSCVSPSNDTLTNCFTNNLIYGNRQTGAFIGVIGATAAGGTLTVNNCYSSGMIEGVKELGGFMAAAVNAGTASVNMTNCYTTAMVGMNSNGTMLGGFLGTQNDLSTTVAAYNIKNCYAAGEVGSLDTDVTPNRTANKDVGGFIGVQTTVGMNYTNCYYDKQTTAAREWAGGAYLNNAFSATTGTSALGILSGITGMLTTDTTKSGAGLTGTSPKPGLDVANGWVLTDDRYPQLAVFANPTDDPASPDHFSNTNWMTQMQLDNLIQAYSQASVSTVFCNTYEQNYDKTSTLPTTTYDTVRDLTLKVPLTPADNTVWQKIAMSGIPTENTSSLYGQTPYVCDLLEDQSGTYPIYIASNFTPGIQWLNVQATVGDQIGQRNLRLVPTANLNVGMDKAVAVDELYNHAADVRLAYSTGLRMSANGADITTGVYPDSFDISDSRYTLQMPLPAAYQMAFDGADNQYTAVNVGQMDLSVNTTEPRTQITSNATYAADSPANPGYPGGVMYVDGTLWGKDLKLDNTGSAQPYNDKFNGVTAFAASDVGSYTITYYWVLQDGRYLTGSKNITVANPLPSSYLKYTGYNMTDGVNGNTGMTSITSSDRFSGCAYVNRKVWFTPDSTNFVMSVDAVTGACQGYPLPSGITYADTTTKFHGDPIYDGRYLWFIPYSSNSLVRLDPNDGSMTTYLLSSGINMTSAAATGANKYSCGILDGQYLWLIPLYSDCLVCIDVSNPNNVTWTGFVISDSGIGMTPDSSTNPIAKFESAAFDGTNIWMVPYSADRLVKVSFPAGLNNAPEFTGYDISGANVTGNVAAANLDPSDTPADADSKYYGCTFDGANLWLSPATADCVVKVSDLDSDTLTVTGYELTDGVNNNINMDTSYDVDADKFLYSVFDGKYVWMTPGSAAKLVKIDTATGQMTGYVIPEYKSMGNDVPYVPESESITNFHNYFNNNNWGMSDNSASGYAGVCFDGNNLWLSPGDSDRVVKISPSVDETLSISGTTVTADLTNYMMQVNPNISAVSTIDKIEWIRVDVSNNRNLTYKGNCTSPYIDVLNDIVTSSDGFDAVYAQLMSVQDHPDAGTTNVKLPGGNDTSAQFQFTASSPGTYYVKAYFTDPVNAYSGQNPTDSTYSTSYNTDRGSAQMVSVIKQIVTPPQKDAYINGSDTAQNGEKDSPVQVRFGDQLKYQVTVNNEESPKPIIYDMVFALDWSNSMTAGYLNTTGDPPVIARLWAKQLILDMSKFVLDTYPGSRICVMGMNSPKNNAVQVNKDGTFQPQSYDNLYIQVDSGWVSDTAGYTAAIKNAFTVAPKNTNDDNPLFLQAAIDKENSRTDEEKATHIPVIMVISDFMMKQKETNSNAADYWADCMDVVAEEYNSEYPNGILLDVRTDHSQMIPLGYNGSIYNGYMNTLINIGGGRWGWMAVGNPSFPGYNADVNTDYTVATPALKRLLLEKAPLAPGNVDTVTDVVPEGLIVDEESISDGGTYDADTRTITWDLSSQPVGLLQLTFNTTVNGANEFDNTANVVYVDGTGKNTNTTYHHCDQYVLHIRQVMLPGDGQNSIPDDLSLPAMGYMQIKGYLSPDLNLVIQTLNITAVSEADGSPQHFTDYTLNSDGQNVFSVTDIVPQYFHYVGYELTPDINIPHSSDTMNSGTNIMLDYSGSQPEYWLTIYLCPNTETPGPNEVAQATNQFGIVDAGNMQGGN
jgi:hypothetical protein